VYLRNNFKIHSFNNNLLIVFLISKDPNRYVELSALFLLLKKERIYYIDNMKFHLDAVEGLVPVSYSHLLLQRTQ